MKKIALLSALSLMAISAAHAATGTITINGVIDGTSCVVTGGTQNDTNFSVTLPTVSTGELSAAGSTAGLTLFNVNVKECADQEVALFFSSANATTAGNLKNTVTTGGSNADIQLVNNKMQAINLNDTILNQAKDVWVKTGTDNSAVLTYGAQYYAAAGAATAGTVNTTVQYTVVYQ